MAGPGLPAAAASACGGALDTAQERGGHLEGAREDGWPYSEVEETERAVSAGR
jgi:hypothetical protein